MSTETPKDLSPLMFLFFPVISQKFMASIFSSFSHAVAHSKGSHLPHCELPCGEAHTARTVEGLQTAAREELNPANNHVRTWKWILP